MNDNHQVSQIFTFTIFSFLLIFILGIIMPRFLSDGTARLNGEEKMFAQYALLRAKNENFENPFMDLLIQKIQVVSIDKVANGPCSIYTGTTDSTLSASYKATVQARTMFAIPIAQARLECDN